ncbi:MAG TPA: hypothetical protein VHJ39_00605 [Solirubrobacteraceae bacterium]|jgi:hypothetical protein|nr:hypothetical protein [Solirubrobacteraceae bacterium]
MITRSTMAAVAALTALGLLAAAAVGRPAAPLPAPKITAAGVGKVKLGKTHARLREQGLVGRLRPGCPLGENTRSARLLAPLRGQVDYSVTNPRVAASVLIRRGAKAKGVGRGDTIPDIRAKFPHARVDKTTEEVFGIWLVKIPKRDGGKFQFAVDAGTKKVTLIGVPFIAFCE